MEVKIQTLTPIWTGGVEAGKCDRIHETGLLGSLRWWMEVLVRGMGGQVCDPTAEGDRNSLDQKKYHESQATDQRQKLRDGGLHCDVSHIFGATAWKRQFRLEVIEDNIKPDTNISSEIRLKSYQYQYKNKNGETKTATGTPQWYFPKNSQDKPREGKFTIKIQSLNPKFNPEIIAGLIQFIADWSALGARPQMGFGIIQVMNEDFSKPLQLNTQPLREWLVTTAGNANTQQLDDYKHLPSLQNIFLAQITPKDSNALFKEEDTFNLKYDLRNCFRVALGKPDNLRQLRHFIMGAAPKDSDKEDDKMATKIKISRPYDNEKLIRVWGWIPEESHFYKNGWDREKIVNDIYKHLKENSNYTLHIWREMNSKRDTATPNETDIQAFLLQLQEGIHAK